MLGPHAHKAASDGELPARIDGIIFANELLDALPCHIVTMTEGGELVEIGVDTNDGDLVECVMPLSTPELRAYLERTGAVMQPSWRAEINLAAVDWVRTAARRLERGFLVLIDYGHPSAELYSAAHAAGTLTTTRRHQVEPGDSRRRPWLSEPGEYDLTAHVDLSSIERTAREEGLDVLGRLDQTYFLLGLTTPDLLGDAASGPAAPLETRLALKTLLLPGGLGSVQKVLLFGRNVGTPTLRGCSFGGRLT
jgi:SAM-dependent MidA family methyltransferase